jgi:hypothetical protein
MKIKKRLSVLLTGLGLFALTFSANAVDLYCNDLGGCGVSVNCGNSGWCGVEWNEDIGGSIIRCGNGLTTAVVCIAPV